MREFRIGSVASIASAIYFFIGYMYSNQSVYFAEIVTALSAKEIDLTRYGAINLMISLLPVFIFQILFGSLLYKEFCSIGVYVFSRRIERGSWFIHKAIQLFLFSVLFRLLMHLTLIGLFSLSGRLNIDHGSIALLFFDVAIYSLWQYFTTLTINTIALRLGSATGFAIIYTLQAVMLSNLLFWESQDTMSSVKISLLWMNPIAHLVLDWHSSFISDVDKYINKLSLSFDIFFSILIFFIIGIVVTLLSWLVVKKHQLISDSER